MRHQPWFKFFNGDWSRDPNLRMCSAATRGIWVDMICAIYELDQGGAIEGTLEQLARIPAVTVSEMRSALEELRDTNTASVTFGDAKTTLVCRRLARESESSQSKRNRDDRYRAKKRAEQTTQKTTHRRRKNVGVESESESESESSLAAASPPTPPAGAPKPQQPAGAKPERPQSTEQPQPAAARFPRSCATIAGYFPAVDAAMLGQIVAKVLQIQADISDDALCDALQRTHQGKRQRSPGLWLKTLPQWLHVAETAPVRRENDAKTPAGSCAVCWGRGEIMRPEFTDANQHIWVDLPPDELMVPCPQCRGKPANSACA